LKVASGPGRIGYSHCQQTVSSGLYRERGKRALDLFIVVLSAPLTCPLTGVAWIIARLSTGGAGFFSQERVGRHGCLFVMWKLRTMRSTPAQDDPAHLAGVTLAASTRITRAGAWLRRTKLDELPQLWNVFRGQMSIVGPRPDVPMWLDELRKFSPVLDVRPGLTGPVSLAVVGEEQVLAGEDNPVAAYGESFLPQKLALNELYARNVSLGLDLRVIGLTLLMVVSKPRAVKAADRLLRALQGNDESTRTS
jgi:lipopolysaccharide/colanic/teichoic acid biosynthesis glycosyltransferase